MIPIRRIRIPNGTTYLMLRQKLIELFGSNNLPQNFIIKYLDDEEDNISITNELEFKEALNFAATTGILKLLIPSEPGKPIKELPLNQDNQYPFLANLEPFLNNPKLQQVLSNPQLLSQLCTILPLINPIDTSPEKLRENSHLLALLASLNLKIQEVSEKDSKVSDVKIDIKDLNPKIDTIETVPKKIEENQEPKVEEKQVEPKKVPEPKVEPKVEEKQVEPKIVLEPKVEPKVVKSESVLSKPIVLLSSADTVTIPDESEIEANSQFIKTWNIKNTGEHSWPDGTKLVCTESDMQSLKHELPIPGIIEPGDSVMLSVTMIAPAIPGRYNSYWRLCTKDNMPFGHRMWAIIHSIKKVEIIPKIDHVTKPSEPTPKQVKLATDQMALWQDKLAELNQMGFSDTEKNIKLLTKNGGKLTETVQELLDG